MVSGICGAGGELALRSMRELLLALLFVAGVALPARAANYTDIWWNAAESGWGLTIAHHEDKVFAVWYLYDEAGKPLWVVMSDGTTSNGGRSFSGDIYRTTGPSYREPRLRREPGEGEPHRHGADRFRRR